MYDTRLIFIECIMGSGKSSTTTFLSLQLQWNQVKHRYVYEAEVPHPTRVRDHVLAPASPEQYVEKSLKSWRFFVEQSSAHDCVYVFDGQLFHGDMSEMVLTSPTDKSAGFLESP